jgi:antitoxin (DNA-binding transcriptional repressor) of toxin-antitoxin stability system
MKAMKLPKEIQSFLDVAEALEEETLVFTKKKRPVAALVSLRKVDRESLALSRSPQFLKIIETARKEVRAGKTISVEALQKKYRVAAPNKRMERTRKTRRLS